MGKHEELTQQFSTWGDKLLQHADVLYDIQVRGRFRPITIQLALCETCDSDCPFCSVGERPLKSKMSWGDVRSVLDQFTNLGAKAVELTGGGNPMLWRDGDRDINDVIYYARNECDLDVGIITNSHDLKKLRPEVYPLLHWVRISLIKLDEGKDPKDYNFRGFPQSKLAFSYIIYEATTPHTLTRIKELVDIHPAVKFVRLAGNCLDKGANQKTKDEWTDFVDVLDSEGKFFIKDIGEDDGPYNDGCYVGLIRPYVAPDPHGDEYFVYACTSHVLQKRTYDPAYALCSIADIESAWGRMSDLYNERGYPYEVNGNGGKNWCGTCTHCFYKNNNRILHTVAHKMLDSNFA